MASPTLKITKRARRKTVVVPERSNEHNARPLDSLTIAELTAASIQQMSRDELTHVVHCAEAGSPQTENPLPRIDFYDRETLERLAFMARRSCQNRVAKLLEIGS